MGTIQLLRGWFLKKGIDIASKNNVIGHLTEEDTKVAELPDNEFKQWMKDQYVKLSMKKRRINNNIYQNKANKRDKILESELGQIKQCLMDLPTVRKEEKATIEVIYNAWAVVTNKRDFDRVFKSRLREYTDAGYFTPLDSKNKKFGMTEKFLRL